MSIPVDGSRVWTTADGLEGLHHALGDKRQARISASGSRMYSVERVRSTQKLPSLPGRMADQPTDESDQDRHAGRGGEEILHSQAQHLGEQAQGRLTTVALPVGVGGEAGRDIEGKTR